jgi:hypothetical protein
VWWLGIVCAASLGGIVVGVVVRRRMERLLAAERDQHDRDVHGHLAEVAMLRRASTDTLAVQAATTVIDNALRGSGR